MYVVKLKKMLNSRFAIDHVDVGCHTVFEINGRPVTPGYQKLGWASKICPWANWLAIDKIQIEDIFWAIKWKFLF